MRALAPFGWLPSEANADFVERKTAETLAKLPDNVRDELANTAPILIDGPAGTWGFCSLEKQNTVIFRMLNPEPGELQEFAQRVVEQFAGRLEHAIGGSVSFPDRIHIRKIENEETVGSGAIDRRPEVSFYDFVRAHRSREFKVMRAGLLMFSFLFLISVLLFYFTESAQMAYWRGWADRVSSAFLVAIITTCLNLLFDFRRWRSRRNSIIWSFGDVHFPSLD